MSPCVGCTASGALFPVYQDTTCVVTEETRILLFVIHPLIHGVRSRTKPNVTYSPLSFRYNTFLFFEHDAAKRNSPKEKAMAFIPVRRSPAGRRII